MRNTKTGLGTISRKLAILAGVKTSDSKDQELKRLLDEIEIDDKTVKKDDVVDGEASDMSGPSVSKDKELSSMEDRYTVEDKKVKKEKALKELQECVDQYVDGNGNLDKIKFHEEAAEKAGVPKEMIDSIFKNL